MNVYVSIRNLATALALAASASTVAAPYPGTINTASEQANMKTVRDLYAAIFVARDPKVALTYLGPEYIQHATGLADGKAGLVRRIGEIARDSPQISYDIKHITAEGNLVAMMTNIQRTPGSLGVALFHIYRLNDGKIVEHWEAAQDVPKTSANSNGIF